MKLSVDISMYPLQEDYKPQIKEFLSELNTMAGDLEIRTSNMSTRVFGEFAAVTELIDQAMLHSMERFGKIVFICKYVQGDARELSGYD